MIIPCYRPYCNLLLERDSSSFRQIPLLPSSVRLRWEIFYFGKCRRRKAAIAMCFAAPTGRSLSRSVGPGKPRELLRVGGWKKRKRQQRSCKGDAETIPHTRDARSAVALEKACSFYQLHNQLQLLIAKITAANSKVSSRTVICHPSPSAQQ